MNINSIAKEVLNTKGADGVLLDVANYIIDLSILVRCGLSATPSKKGK